MKIAFISYTQYNSDKFLDGLVKACSSKGHEVKRFYQFGKPVYNYDWMTDWAGFNVKDISYYGPDLVVIFNGYAPETSGVTSYLRNKYKTVFVERGWFPQEGHVYLDELGLGGRSSLSKKDLSIIDVAQDVATKEVNKTREDLYNVEDCPGHGDYILVPLQLDHDTSVTLDSPYFKTMHSLLQFARHMFPKEKIVVSPHPLNKNFPVPNTLIKVDNIPTIRLAKSAKAIIGINSTLMLESLIFHKPVFMLGNSVIRDSRITPSPEDFISNPQYTLNNHTVDKDRIDRVIYSLLNTQFRASQVPDRVVKQIEIIGISKL